MNNFQRTIVDLCQVRNNDSWVENIKEFNDLMLKKHPDLVAECNGIFISFIELEKLSVYSKVLIDFHQWTEEKEHNKRIKLKNVLKNQ
jgi:hypothetical protein